jgi:pyridoxine/pyridoxamine 5'-phosphate oxidase
VDADGLPNVRMVLLKEIEDATARGRPFVFYTNYDSAQGAGDRGQGKAAFVMHWKSLRRQIRVRGTVTREEGPQADAYYASRSLKSRLGAWASRSRSPVLARALMAEVAKVATKGRTRRARRSGAASASARRNRVLGRRRLPVARPLPLVARDSENWFIRSVEPLELPLTTNTAG